MNGKTRYILTSILCDLLLLAVLLLSFAWHHHVKRMSDSADKDDGGVGIIGRDEVDDDDDDDKDKDKETDNADGDADGDAVDKGDFGGTLPDVFAEEGVVDKGDGYYRSHDIYMTVTEVIAPVDDYVAKYFVYDVYVRHIENLFAVASDTRRPFTELVDAAEPIGAVSGDFWGNSAAVAVRNGKVLVQNDRIANDICVLYRDGTMEIVSPREYSKDYFEGKDVYQVWDFGPSLLDGKGVAYDSFDDYSDITSRNPRSSIGYYEPGHYVFIVVEGRVDLMYEGELTYFKGMRLPDLAKIYEELGVTLAYNLDGGDSAFAYYDGEILRQDYERATEPDKEPREIYDIIAVGEVGNE